MEGEIQRECVCGSHDYKQVYYGKQAYWKRSWSAIQSDFEIIACRRCGLKRTWPMPYTSDLDTAVYRDGTQNLALTNEFNDGRTIRANRRLLELLPLKPPGKLLDIGCGAGFLVREALQLGWEAMGIDLDEQRIAVGQQHFKIANLVLGDLTALQFPDQHFKVVTASHLLEHIVDIKGFLTEVWRILEPSGILAFEVPNYDSWTAAIMKHYPRRPWYGVVPHQHVWQMGPVGMHSIFRTLARYFTLEQLSCAQNLDHGSPRLFGTVLRMMLAPNAWFGRGDRMLGIARRLP